MKTREYEKLPNYGRSIANLHAYQLARDHSEGAFRDRFRAAAHPHTPSQSSAVAQKVANPLHHGSINEAGMSGKTGLPAHLKAGIEQLSGYSMEDVKVHYNSDKPAQLKAYAYAQGTDIHLAPGQEKHLPHEAWHVVQQKQGRVEPTTQLKSGIAVNDDAALEKEADVMGQKSLLAQRSGTLPFQFAQTKPIQNVLQGAFEVTIDHDMVGKEVIVTTHEYPEFYGKTGKIVRRSRGNWRKWTVEIDGARWGDDLIRFSSDELSLTHNHEQEEAADVAPVGIPDRARYRLYNSRNAAGQWTELELDKKVDGTLIDGKGEKYRLLNIRHGANLPFVSKKVEDEAAQPSLEFVAFLHTYGFQLNGQGKIQDRIHAAVVGALLAEKKAELAEFLKHENNGKWYTNNIRQGGLNELILTSQSVDAVGRGIDDQAFDPGGQIGGHAYTFVQLQHDTSFPTKDFVFKETYEMDGKAFQNSHVNARMYRMVAGTKHRTVGPESPQYHLAVSQDSLKSLFDRSHSMQSLVGRLIELHKHFLATKQDILSVPASSRGDQIYEMRGGHQLKLNDPKDLALFAEIVGNHTLSVMNQLKALYLSLEPVPDRPPASPHRSPSPMGPAAMQSPYSPSGF